MPADVQPFETRVAAPEPDALAPDGSQIRLLPVLRGGGAVHCTLPPGGVSRAVVHKSVEEIWYFLRGEGEVWRSQGGREEMARVAPGSCLTIPLGTHFQFRNTGVGPLEFFIVTMPPWPGDQEAGRVRDHWPAD